MISKLLIIDKDSDENLCKTINILIRNKKDVRMIKYDFSKGFIETDTNKNLFFNDIRFFIRENALKYTVKIKDVCIINSKKANTIKSSSLYNNFQKVKDKVKDKDNYEEWDFLFSTIRLIYFATAFDNFDFIDINHLLQTQYYSKLFEHVNKNINNEIKDEHTFINCLSYNTSHEPIRTKLSDSFNWIHLLCSTLRSEDTNLFINKYFNINNTSLNMISRIPLEPDLGIKYYLNTVDVSGKKENNVINNIILYDAALQQPSNNICDILLENTLVISFEENNSFEELQDILISLQKQDEVEIYNVSLFHSTFSNILYNPDVETNILNLKNIKNKKEKKKQVQLNAVNNFVIKKIYQKNKDITTNEEITNYISKLNTNNFEDFMNLVLFLKNTLCIKYFDLITCNTFSKHEWSSVIEFIVKKMNDFKTTDKLYDCHDIINKKDNKEVIELYFNKKANDSHVSASSITILHE